ncbi:MAG TPA: hypothetical protein VEL49_03380 [Ktedonobacteraceae bacterium]|nr:hypothetical protein [Ktedonobacteraceae bacterium]
MANKESESSPEFEQHELVERLRPDPNTPPPPDLLVVNGWRGKSNLEGYCRIYLTASLTDHVDYPCEDEVFSQSLTNEGSSLSQPPTQVRIKPSNNVLYTHTERHDPQRQLQFMVGPLSARFLPGTGSGGTFGGRAARPIVPIWNTVPGALGAACGFGHYDTSDVVVGCEGNRSFIGNCPGTYIGGGCDSQAAACSTDLSCGVSTMQQVCHTDPGQAFCYTAGVGGINCPGRTDACSAGGVVCQPQSEIRICGGPRSFNC